MNWSQRRYEGCAMAVTTRTEDLGYTPNTDGVWSWLTTVDHKRIGILYGVSALVFAFVGGFEALLIRTQLTGPNGTVLSADAYNQLFTMHGVTMEFAVIMPVAAAFQNYMIPLQIGARDVAFPRLNAFSYWLFLFSVVMLTSSFFIGGSPDGAWTGYANLSTEVTEFVRMDYYAIGLQLLGIASIGSSANFIATIFTMRAPGMTMMRMPVFTWMSVVTSFLLILSMPRDRRGTVADVLRPQLRDGVLRGAGSVVIHCCGSTCSGSSATLRYTCSSCQQWASSPRPSQPSLESRYSDTPSWCSPASPSGSSASGCGHTTCSLPA